MSADTDGTIEFIEMFRAQYTDVLRFVRRRASRGDVEYVVRETFRTAWRRRGRLPGQQRVWLLRTAREVMLGLDRQGGAFALSVRIKEEPDFTDRLVSAWHSLTDSDQEVLALHVWEKLPDAEAARVLGCARIAYSLRLALAGRRLAARMP